ncbi:hypothetical protein T09_5132 [Trichinella sp. T9]|nr:hypothetical protein T09_5132 [Trichinella sp. T9]
MDTEGPLLRTGNRTVIQMEKQFRRAEHAFPVQVWVIV